MDLTRPTTPVADAAAALADEVRRQPDGSFADLERTVMLSALIPNHPRDVV